MNQPIDSSVPLLAASIAAAVVYLYVQARLLSPRRPTPVRFLALIPASTMTILVTRIVWNRLRDPSTHELWPFEIMAHAVVSTVFLGLFRGIYALIERHRAARQHEETA